MYTRNCYVPLLLLSVLASLSLLSYVHCFDSDVTFDNGNGGFGAYDKRWDRSDWDSDRRSYIYTNANGVKRLPVYNFGLGKRARPYSFGLGKRTSEYDEDGVSLDGEGFYEYLVPEQKRNRPYSFGLGKREFMHDDKRKNPYGFGLGRR